MRYNQDMLGEADVHEWQGKMVGALNEDCACMLALMMDHVLSERDNTMGLNVDIERIVDANGHFDGRNLSRYMVQAYKTEQQIRGIPEAKQWTSFLRVVAISLNHSWIVQIQATTLNWQWT